MDFFQYQNNQLYCEDVPLETIASQLGTPTYVYSTATFKNHFEKLQSAFSEIDTLICYSVKVCGNINICRLLGQLGSGFDVVSGGELYRVLQAEGYADKVVYAGVGKTDQEIKQAIEAGIAYFNIESPAELENLIRLAGQMQQTVQAALRVNPDVDPKTHRHTTTGKKETKFGIDIENAPAIYIKYGNNEFVKLSAIHVHIGSPVNTVEPYQLAIGKALKLIDELRAAGFTINALDIGGGFGADYTVGQAPLSADYARVIVPMLKGKNLKLIIEPGRSLAANTGVLLTKVLYLKQGGKKNFVIVDSAMNDLIRPALYDAFHFIWPVNVTDEFLPAQRLESMELPGTKKFDVVGPICETADYLARDRFLPPVQRDDLLAVFTAGAYGFAMSSQYNSRPRAAEVLVDGETYRVIRKRETYHDLIAGELD